MKRRYVYRLSDRRLPPGAGAKARNLGLLMRKGFVVPDGYVCSWDAHLRYRDGDRAVTAAVRRELAGLLDPGSSYAVRSSAGVEDGQRHSFAGQFTSVLNVRGLDDVLAAVTRVWDSAAAPRALAYARRAGIAGRELKMAVIVQRMAEPVLSGVAFSRNPVTGMDEVVIETVRGTGEALLQGGATPARFVSKWGSWLELPLGWDDAAAAAQEVAGQTGRIAAACGHAVDLEWVYDGRSVSWVQMRRFGIDACTLYSCRISREVFPGMIKPLVFSVNVPMVNRAWMRLFDELTGPGDIDPDSLARSFYFRVYFNMSAVGSVFEKLAMPRQSLELLMGIELDGPDKPTFRPGPGILRHLPRVLCFALRRIGYRRRMRPRLRDLRKRFRDAAREDKAGLGMPELLERVDSLRGLVHEAAYLNINSFVLMALATAVLKALLRLRGIAFESLSLTADLRGLRPWDPMAHLRRLSGMFRKLAPEVRQRISDGGGAALAAEQSAAGLRQGLAAFFERFGHLSDSSSDFSAPPWKDTPELVLSMVLHHADGPAEKRGASGFRELPVPALWKLLLGPACRQAARLIGYRDMVSSLYTYGYGLFRPCFLALGDRLARQGLLERAADIYFLQEHEVRQACTEPGDAEALQEVVRERKADFERNRDVELPPIIYGESAVPIKTAPAARLKGVATSQGCHTGRVKVVRGMHEIDKLDRGDVLTIAYSDVGLTPLFARAGAVIAESGGLLSHSSLVAREYGIPAVVSVPGACRLRDHMLVTVDGFRGEILVHQPQEGSW